MPDSTDRPFSGNCECEPDFPSGFTNLPGIARFRLAGRLRRIHSQQIKSGIGDCVYSETTRASSETDLAGRVSGIFAKARRRIRRVLCVGIMRRGKGFSRPAGTGIVVARLQAVNDLPKLNRPSGRRIRV